MPPLSSKRKFSQKLTRKRMAGRWQGFARKLKARAGRRGTVRPRRHLMQRRTMNKIQLTRAQIQGIVHLAIRKALQNRGRR